MRDFSWNDTLYAVVKNDGRFAGVPCLSYSEALDLAAQHDGSFIFLLEPTEDANGQLDDSDEYDYDSYTITDIDCGFDPYMGCYSDDC